jgi:hypothetical protein
VSLVAVVAWGVFALMIGFVGMVIYATLRQIDGEARRAAEERDG